MIKCLAIAWCLLGVVTGHGSPVDLIGARPVDPGEYQEVVRIHSEGSWCTASVIGKRVVLTAAHCVRDGGEVAFDFNRKSYYARCQHAPNYTRSVGDQDAALCLLSEVFPGPVAHMAGVRPKLGDDAVLIGYGCTNSSGGGGNDGVLRVGLAPVVKESSDAYYSYHAKGDTALCFGDSGGPAFISLPHAAVNYIAGVNSRGNIIDLSLLTDMAHPDSIEFMKQFCLEHDVKICGLNSTCSATQKK